VLLDVLMWFCMPLAEPQHIPRIVDALLAQLEQVLGMWHMDACGCPKT